MPPLRLYLVSSFLLFFPFAFLTTTFVPEEALTGWLATIATYNPVTYILQGMRSLSQEGWNAGDLAACLAAIGAIGVICIGVSRGVVRPGMAPGAVSTWNSCIASSTRSIRFAISSRRKGRSSKP